MSNTDAKTDKNLDPPFPEITGSPFERAVVFVGMIGMVGEEGRVEENRNRLALDACRFAGLPESEAQAVRRIGYAIVQYRKVLRAEKKPQRFLATACALHGAEGHEVMVEALALKIGAAPDPVEERALKEAERRRQRG